MVGFLRPELLFITPLVLGLLVYAYLNRGKHSARVIGSLIFLKDFQTKIPKRAKITIPVRLFLELLALLLLLAAASGVYLRGAGQRIAFVYDNSLSTAATSSSHGSIATFLMEQAKEAASEYSSADVIDLYITNSPEKNRTGLSPHALEAALYHIEPEFGEDGLERMLGQLSPQSYDKITVISDKHSSSSNTTHYDFYPRTPIQDSFNNLAIERAMLRDGAEERLIDATIRSFSEKEVRTKIQIFSVDGEESEVLLREATLDVPSRQSISRRIPVGQAVPKGYRVKLTFSSTIDDNLELDNTFFISGDGAQSDEVIYVGDLDPESLQLTKIKSYPIRGIKPQEYEGYSNTHLPSLYIFHRYAPATLPKRSSLFIMPQGDSPLFSIKGSYNDLQLSRWLSSHPITNYLNLSLLTIPSAQTMTPPPWQESVLSTAEGTVLTAGVTGGNRYVASGFELFPFAGKDSPFLSVLTLNILGWLSDESLSQNMRYEGEKMKMRLTSLKPINDRNFRGVPGLYVVETKDGKDRIVGSTYFESSESNLREKNIIPPPNSRSSGAEQLSIKEGKSNVATILTLLLLMIVIFDTLYQYKKGKLIGMNQQ